MNVRQLMSILGRMIPEAHTNVEHIDVGPDGDVVLTIIERAKEQIAPPKKAKNKIRVDEI